LGVHAIQGSSQDADDASRDRLGAHARCCALAALRPSSPVPAAARPPQVRQRT
jgi:hypothetical protein